MKSVDKTPYAFRRRYSGLTGENLVGHLDLLEIHQTNRHQWSAREFYHGLQLTLAGRSKATALTLEEGLEEVDLARSLPDWFQCEVKELGSMVDGRMTFAQLEPRTKVVILISHFHAKFQRLTPDQVQEDFGFDTQEHNESLEDWDTRISRLSRM